MEKNNTNPGLSERILREIIATPALKELILLQMKDIKAETAAGLVKTLLWGDPGISLSLFGALPDAANWLLELLLELGGQLNGLPEPLLKDILAQVGGGIDTERLKRFPEVYGRLSKRLLFGDDATPEDMEAAVVGAANSALAGLDRLTASLDRNRAGIAASLSRMLRELDRAALARSLRRMGSLAAAAARRQGRAEQRDMTGWALAAAGAVLLLAMRRRRKRRKG